MLHMAGLATALLARGQGVKHQEGTMNYESLLEMGLEKSDSFSLVWRDELEYNDHCKSIENMLLPFLVKEERLDEWPGTKLFGSLATVRRYSVSSESIEILKKANSFSDWQSPNYPEDLAFYKGGEVVYLSIAHENEEWPSKNA